MKKGSKLKAQLSLYVLLCLSLFVAACSSAPEVDNSDRDAKEVMETDERLGTFGTAMTTAGMDSELGEKPLTVFVPTLDAFESYAEAQGLSLGELLASPQLGLVLQYHIVPGLFRAEDLPNFDELTTLSGEAIAVEVTEEGVTLNGSSKVIEADIRARRTIIHVIDTVLEPPTTTPDPDIVDIALSDERFSILVAALKKADLVDALKADGPFTVFAPTNKAFEKLLKDLDVSAEELLANPDLKSILLYHVLGARVSAAEAAQVDSATTLEGRDIAIEARGNNLFINGNSKVVQADINASNGVIHAINRVLLPPTELGTIPEVAAADGRFSTLVAALGAANLVDALSAEGPFTVFAPTDDAFAALLEQLGVTPAELLANPELATILKYHVVPGKVMAADIVNLTSVTTLAEKDVSIEVVDGGVVLNGSVNLIETDIEASNGVIHVLDGVLLPSEPKPSIVDIVVNDERFSILEAALGKAGLVDALSADGPFTVFAPSNDAFVALAKELHVAPEDLLELPNLKDILLYHVASGKVTAEQAATLDKVTTLQGADIKISTDGHGGLVLNDKVNITETDIEASNGIIHVINKVLLPPQH